MHNGEFQDARLVEIYDLEFPWSRDDDYFLSVLRDFSRPARPSPAAGGVVLPQDGLGLLIEAPVPLTGGSERPVEEPARRVLDLGCGAGRLALALAAAGYEVTGVDPAPASLRAARAKPGAERVTWLDGSTEVLSGRSFDACVMTSHVAQFFVTDEEWATALAHLAEALVSGALLAFDSRDPAARGWEAWNSEHAVGDVRIRSEVTAVANGVVSATRHYTMPHGSAAESEVTLRFRTEDELRDSLHAAGFEIEAIHGGWNREPIGAPDGEFLVIARRTASPGRD
jgi:SAM-dependent methyltransferase